ncbi:hypothetical protein ACFL5L_02980 [candidate division KSB1 bacterium]
MEAYILTQGQTTVKLYFGKTNPPPLVLTTTDPKEFVDSEEAFAFLLDPGLLEYETTYYWITQWVSILSSEQKEDLITPVFSFKTELKKPQEQRLKYPGNHAINIPIDPRISWRGPSHLLTWGIPIPDIRINHTYDIYLGTTNPPPLVQSNNDPKSYSPDTLSYQTKYYCQIVAKNTVHGLSTPSQVYDFTTMDNPSPDEPSSPDPADGATGVSRNTGLNWTGGGVPDADLMYDIYFGTDNPPPLVQSHNASASYNPDTLDYGTTYYWQIVSRDVYWGVSTPGPVWSFTTEYLPYPYPPRTVSPSDGASVVSINTDLNWHGGGPSGTIVTYDIYFGTEDPPPLVESDHTLAYYDLATLSYKTTYYWKIVSKNDAFGLSTTGPVWSFTTEGDPTPYEPSNPTPADGETDAHIFSGPQWSGGSERGTDITYDIYFGTMNPPPLIQSDFAYTSYPMAMLNYSTTYYWQIVAKNNVHGMSVPGPVWSFTTMDLQLPYEPSNPIPSDGAAGVPISSIMMWTGGGPGGITVSYDIYFGTTNPPPLVEYDMSVEGYSPGTPLNYGTTYYWNIVARDYAQDVSTPGAVWSFTTEENPTPYEPLNPSPADASTGISVSTGLSWTGGGPSGTTVTYDIYYGTDDPPPLVQSDNSTASYDPGTSLSYNTTYFWKIVSKNNSAGLSTSGAVWSFTTGLDLTPYEPSSPSPADASTGISVSTGLSWTGGGPSGTTVTYDIYFGTSGSPPLVQSGNSAASYNPGTLSSGTTYYWKIVSKNTAQGLSRSGDVWSFTTFSNQAPNQPGNPSPSNGATGVSLSTGLSWTGGDPDGDAVTYDIYFGTSGSPPLVQSNNSAASYNPGTLSSGTTYYWKIVAKDEHGASTAGSVWSFTATSNQAPNLPANPMPANAELYVSWYAGFGWTGGDPDGDTVTYDIYLGTTNPPPLLQPDNPTNSYYLDTLSATTTYYWKIVAKDEHGASTAGPVWTFTTTVFK